MQYPKGYVSIYRHIFVKYSTFNLCERNCPQEVCRAKAVRFAPIGHARLHQWLGRKVLLALATSLHSGRKSSS